MKKHGKILVIAGRAGSGKDLLIERLVQTKINNTSFTRIVTHASRKPREDEIDGVHYHFCTKKELFRMHKCSELVEEPVQTGSSFKATSKNELLEVFSGKHKIWRIDLSLATKIASGTYYKSQFSTEIAEKFMYSTQVIYVDVDQETLESRRRKRDGKRYIHEEYIERDKQEIEVLNSMGHHFTIRLNNPDNDLENTEKKLFKVVEDFLNS